MNVNNTIITDNSKNNDCSNIKRRPINSNPDYADRVNDTVWLIVPFAMEIKNNIVRSAFQLIYKHFTKGNKYWGLIISKTIRIGYSVTHNLATIISSLNIKKLNFFYSNRVNDNANNNNSNINNTNNSTRNNNNNNHSPPYTTFTPYSNQNYINPTQDRLCGC